MHFQINQKGSQARLVVELNQFMRKEIVRKCDQILHAEAHRIQTRGLSEIEKANTAEQKHETGFQRRMYCLHQVKGKTLSIETSMTSVLMVLPRLLLCNETSALGHCQVCC